MSDPTDTPAAPDFIGQVILDFSRVTSLSLDSTRQDQVRIYSADISLCRGPGEGIRNGSVSGLRDAAEAISMAYHIAERGWGPKAPKKDPTDATD